MTHLPSTPRPRVAAALGAVGGVLVLLLLVVRPLAPLAFDDLAQLAAAVSAAVACAGGARRSSGRRRQAWTALALGCASWCAGQLLWTWAELVDGREAPFPSAADVGFLGFPVGAVVALVLHPTGGTPGDRGRRLLDGLVVATSLTLVAWSTVLGPVVADDDSGALAWVVGTAYPAADVLALTMVFVLLSRATDDRLALRLVGAGIAAITVGDSAFLYLTATGTYTSAHHVVTLAWCLGFVVVGVAGRVSALPPDPSETRPVRPPPSAGFLPYVPLLAAGLLLAGRALGGRPLRPVEVALGAALVVAVLGRQYALLLSHGRLLDELAVREAELRTLAYSDGLTGLANRAAFLRRLEQALVGHAQGRRSVVVLFCDLDDFKIVNDTLGHAAGDLLLAQAAARLAAVLRSADLLSRLGGDEFAVLLQDGTDAEVVGRLVTECLSEPFDVGAGTAFVGASVGTTTVAPGVPTPTADDVLAQADSAMYAVKRGGKGAARAYEQVARSALTG